MRLFKYQTEVLKQTEDRNRCAYYLDMGLGKTFVGSEKIVRLGASLNLIICQKSKIRDWVEHFHDNHGIDVVDLTVAKNMASWTDSESNGVFIINYELAWRRPQLLTKEGFTLMLDESSLIQNPKAKQSKFILKLRPENVILLSGTPCSGKYENLWTQAQLIGWNIGQDVFEQTYINWETFKVGKAWHKRPLKKNPYKNVERLKDKFRENGAVFMKTEDVIELPDQVFSSIKVEPSKEYKTFMKDRIVTIDGREFIGNTPLSMMTYAREICAIHTESKIQALMDLLNSSNDRFIVFYNFTEEMKRIEDLCISMDRPTSIMNGIEKDLTCYREFDDSVTLCQYQAGSMGLNLQKSNKIVFFSPTLRVDQWMQSQKRTHRVGQERTCFYYKLIVEKSIEESIYKALDKGLDYTLELFNGIDR